MKDDWDKKLKEKRQRLGWTQKKMAQELDVSLRTYESYERGETTPNINFKAKVNNRLSGGKFKTNLQSIRPIVSSLKNKIPNIEKDNSWHDGSTSHIKNLTNSFKNLVYSLSEAILKEKKVMNPHSIYDFDHKEKIILENQIEKLEKELEGCLNTLNLEEIFYEIKQGENKNQIDIILQTKEKLESKDIRVNKNSIFSIFRSSKKDKIEIENKFKELENQIKNEALKSREEERDLLLQSISKKMSKIYENAKVINDYKKSFDAKFDSIQNSEIQRNLALILQSFGLQEGTIFFKNENEPEYIINLPSSSKIYINYNCPLNGFKKLFSNNNLDEQEPENIKVEIADQFINHIMECSRKNKEKKNIRSAHIIFVPNDNFLKTVSEGLSLRKKDEAYAAKLAEKHGIIVATPNTLYSYLSNRQKLSSETIKYKEMEDRVKKIKKEFSDHLEKMAKAAEAVLETKFEDKLKNYDQDEDYNDYSYSSEELREEDYYERKEEL